LSVPSANARTRAKTEAAPARLVAAESGASWFQERAQEVGSIRIPDFVLFFALAMSGGLAGLSFQPTALVLAVLAVLGAWRRPRLNDEYITYSIVLTWVALAYVAVVSMVQPQPEEAASWGGRLLRLTVTFAVLFFLSSDRLDLRSAMAGYAAAALVNIPVFYAGLSSNAYGGYLTGWFGDKNVSGMAYCLLGIMVMWLCRSRLQRGVIYAGFAVPLWLTGSRTSMAAYVAGGVWLFFAPKLPVFGRLLLGGLIFIVVQVLATQFAQIGVFEEREGSDALRSAIDSASIRKVDESGFFGRGLGNAFVDMGVDGTWFFHNSYWTALVEGGWPWVCFVTGLTVLAMIRPLERAVERTAAIGQGCGVAALICASQLGEVFGTVAWMLACAFAIRVQLVAGSRGTKERSERFVSTLTGRGH